MNNNYIQGFDIDWSKIDSESYLRKIKAFKDLKSFSFNMPITFFIGDNGSGKSTLLNAIALSYGFNYEGGSLNYCFSTYQSDEQLSSAMTLYKGYNRPKYAYFFKAETFYNIATKEEEYAKGPGGKPQNYHLKSHGESFFQLFSNLEKGLFILDEPEAALSYQKQLSLLYLFNQAIKKGSQFIIASHSPILLSMNNAQLYNFDDNGINECIYEDSESYKIIKSFINHKDTMLKELSADDEKE